MLFDAGKYFSTFCAIGLIRFDGILLSVHCSRPTPFVPVNGLNSLNAEYFAATSLKSPARIAAVGTL